MSILIKKYAWRCLILKKYFYLFVCSLIIILSILVFDYKVTRQNNKYDGNNTEIKTSYSDNKCSPSTSMIDNNTYSSVQCANKVHITIQEFLNNMQCSHYKVQEGETLTDISNNYSSTCTLNASLKLIKAANNIQSPDAIQSGMVLNIPEIILKNGTLHKVVKGDSWNKICNEYYPIYDLNYIMQLLVYINDLNDDTLPLNTVIFLPKI